MSAALFSLEQISKQLDPSPEIFEKMCQEAVRFCLQHINETSSPSNNNNNMELKAWMDYNPEDIRQTVLKSFEQFPEQVDQKLIDVDINSSPNELSALMKPLLDKIKTNILQKGMIATSPNFYGYVLGGSNLASTLGDLIGAICNRFTGFFPAQPGMVLLENQLVKFFGTQIGFFDPLIEKEKPKSLTSSLHPNNCYGGGGFFASGTSTATISAFCAARDAHKIFLGSEEYERAVVYMTKEAHSCLGKALHLIGLKSVKLRHVPTHGEMHSGKKHCDTASDPTEIETRYLTMNICELKKMIKHDVEELGLKPFLIVGSAGTVNTGAIDDLEEIGKIAKSAGAWFHVDGAYGGSFAFCDKVLEEADNEDESDFMSPRAAVEAIRRGFSLADSACVDQHKGMYVSYGCGLCLVKDIHQLAKSHSVSASYLHNFMAEKEEGAATTAAAVSYPIISSSDLSAELTKPNRLLRLWIPLQLFGFEPYRLALKEKLLLARYLAAQLRKVIDEETRKNEKFPSFEIIPPQASIVAFRIAPRRSEMKPGEDEEHYVNSGTYKLERQMFKRGNAFASPTSLNNGKVRWLRACILNFRCHKENMDFFVQEIINCVKAHDEEEK